MSGISRKLPDTERTRLKAILKKIVPDDAGVIVRTAAEGATEEQLTHDVERLHGAVGGRSRRRPKTASRAGAAVRRARPDGAGRPRPVQRGLRRSSSSQGDDAWDTVQTYVGARRARPARPRAQARRRPTTCSPTYRVDEQIAKALDRKVWLPSGGSLVIDRTEAMTVVDVNTGKFVGKGPATSRRRSPATTSRPPRRSSASSGCATSAGSSSSTSSTWCSSPTATSCCAG